MESMRGRRRRTWLFVANWISSERYACGILVVGSLMALSSGTGIRLIDKSGAFVELELERYTLVTVPPKVASRSIIQIAAINHITEPPTLTIAPMPLEMSNEFLDDGRPIDSAVGDGALTFRRSVAAASGQPAVGEPSMNISKVMPQVEKDVVANAEYRLPNVDDEVTALQEGFSVVDEEIAEGPSGVVSLVDDLHLSNNEAAEIFRRHHRFLVELHAAELKGASLMRTMLVIDHFAWAKLFLSPQKFERYREVVGSTLRM